MRPATAATLLSLALSPLYNWLLIFRLGWGLDGAVLAVDAVQVGVFSVVVIMCVQRWLGGRCGGAEHGPHEVSRACLGWRSCATA